MPVHSLQPALDQSAARVLSFIREHSSRERLRPTAAEIARDLGQSLSQVESHVRDLCRHGHVERLQTQRGIVLVLLELDSSPPQQMAVGY